MGKINILDSSCYNQISAGEVVENPASIIKELVENSIDAGASRISVMIEDGGIKSIVVIDDGEGMEAEDLTASIMPHATSKIKSASDLLTVSTLGFRGEALASIAAVSHFEIKSKHITAEFANKLAVRGGDIIENVPTALEKGTSISVSNLFFNTPARYKFLKSKRGEEAACTSALSELILSNPDIVFEYRIDGKIKLSTDGNGLFDAINSIYGSDFSADLLPLSHQEQSFRLNGYIAKPTGQAIKSNKNSQTLIINGRVIRDIRLSAVIQNAYGEALMKRTFPAFILELIMPFDEVDINVHPNKKEVRFSNANQISGLFYRAVRDTLSSFYNGEKAAFSESFLSANSSTVAINEGEKTPTENDAERISFFDADFLKNTTGNASKCQNDSAYGDIPTKNSENQKENRSEDLREFYRMAQSAPKAVAQNDSLNNIISVNESISSYDFRSNQASRPEEENALGRNFHIIGQLFETYILVECDSTLYIIDQHAAHERIIYDNLIKSFNVAEKNIQPLLFPHLYNAGTEHEFIVKNIPLFASFGFELEEFGGRCIKVCGIPMLLGDFDIDGFFEEIKANIFVLESTKFGGLLQEKLAKMACKSAIKGGRSLSNHDIETVLSYFISSGMPWQCPHGRPVIAKLSKKDIEKMFRRIV